MIREEYDYKDIEDYLISSETVLIAGCPTQEERSIFFSDKWKKNNQEIVFLNKPNNQFGNIDAKFLNKNGEEIKKTVNLRSHLLSWLKQLNLASKIIILDLSSLDNVLIMYLAKIMVNDLKPRLLFATYIRPEKYIQQSGDIGFDLCDQVSPVAVVPGFAKRMTTSPLLYAFIGFDGIRLKNIIESENNIQNIVPIVPFPQDAPNWYRTTIWNSMEILNSFDDISIRKCLSDSVFEAFDLLCDTVPKDKEIILVPLGTRPHSLACALYANTHPHAKVIYDYVTENEHRAIGIATTTVYHLSAFIKT